MAVFHPDLAVGRFIPKLSFGPRLARFQQGITVTPKPTPVDMLIENVTVPATEAGPSVRLRVYRPKRLGDAPTPALFWIHGGGYIGGVPENDERTSIDFARTLGITVVAVQYRLAPTHTAPAAVDDAYAGLRWVFEHAAERNIDANRIAVGGASAGGGLAAGLVLYAHDLGQVHPAFQLLVYPMLDDRTVDRTDHDTKNVRVWTPKSNRFAWTSYLGAEPGGADVSPYSAPARRDDLTGLPPAWIGVGTLDLFQDEDLEYARRLRESGVPCDLTVVPGAFHGFDIVFWKKAVSKNFFQTQVAALKEAFGL